MSIKISYYTHTFVIVPLLLVLNLGSIHAQTLSGRITDSVGQPVTSASVLLTVKKTFIAGTVSTASGSFILSYRAQSSDTLSLRITCTGYQPFTRHFVYPDTGFLHSIMLQPDPSSLQGVTVTARAPLVTRKSDRYIINVENSFLANGNNGLEVLQKSPGIWVDNNGAIRIRGNQTVRVMINDVMQNMSEEELANYLRTFKSEEISRIEVIQNPPAEFEAAGTGGIIHIILKKVRKDGLNGSATAQYRYQGHRPYISAGSLLHYKFRNLYVTAGYTYSSDRRAIKEKTNIDYADTSAYSNQTARRETFSSHQYRVGITWEPSSKQSISIQTIQSYTNILLAYHTNTVYRGSWLISGINLTDKSRRFRYGSTTFNYSLKLDTSGSLLKIIADYNRNDKKENNDFYEVYDDPQQNATYRIAMPFLTDNASAQADYVKVLHKKNTLKAGIRYATIKRDNTTTGEIWQANNWISDAAQTNRFIYTENLLMGYISGEGTWKRTSIQAGLRAEETFSKGNSVTMDQQFKRSYFGLFPSLFITQTLDASKGNSVYINYARRLSRPGLRDLNPFRQLFNNNTSMTGNPNLLPQYTHSMSAGFRWHNNYSADLFYNYTSNVINLSAFAGPGNSIDYMAENVHSSNEYGISCNALLPIIKGWTASNSASLFQGRYHFYNEPVKQTSFRARSIHTIVLKNVADLDLTVSYSSPYRYSNIYNVSNFSFDAGVSIKVYKAHGRIRLYAADIFNTLREKELTQAGNTTILFYRKRQTRYASLSLTWNFSTGKKFTNSKIEQGGAEERGRIGS